MQILNLKYLYTYAYYMRTYLPYIPTYIHIAANQKLFYSKIHGNRNLPKRSKY